MKDKKSLTAGVISLVCILVNIGGKALARALELPLWLDVPGTMITAYIYGPAAGAVVGASTNIAYHISSPAYSVYALTNITVGIIVGLCARRKLLEKLFGMLTMSFLVTLSSVILSTPLNFIFFNGNTGNKWGDGVIGFLTSLGWNKMISCAVGEFYVDFVDKLLTVFVLALLLRLYRHFRSKHVPKSPVKAISISLVFLLCAGTAPVTVCAKDSRDDYSTYLHTTYNSENGLLGGTANDIAQTSDGVLWIGTYGGLYRYTGTTFHLMNRFSSIKNVNCFCADEEGRLWVGTNDNGLSICINNEISNVLTHKEGLPSDSVRCIAESGSGFYYVGTTGALALVSLANGLSVTDIITGITSTKNISVNGEYAAAVNDNGELFLLKGTEIIGKNTDNFYTCCIFDSDGNLYAGTSGNTIQIFGPDGHLGKKSTIGCGELSSFNSFTLSDTGEILLCAENGAGYIDQSKMFHAINLGKFNNSLEHVIFDYQGNIWFTSSRLGLLKLCRSPFTELFTKLEYEENVVNTIGKWQDNFYFGTDNGLYAADSLLSEKVENTLTKQLNGIRIRCLMTDSTGKLCISTMGSGVLCAEQNGSITVYKNDTGALGDRFRQTIETKSGTVLLAGDYGITYIKNGNVIQKTDMEDGLSTPKTLCLLEAENSDILAGTDGGGIAVITNGKVSRLLTKENGLSSDIIMKIIADDGGYFIVTSNNLCYMDRDYKIRILDQFPYYNNYDIIKRSDGMLFVPGLAGICVIDRDCLLGNSADYTLLEYSKGLRMSLTSNSWSYVDEEENLYLCGGTGASVFHLYNYSTPHRSYRMSLQQIEVDGELYLAERDDVISIPRGANRIVLSPDIVNYSISDPNVSVYLEGFDETKKTMPLSKLSECVYTNIPTGEYTFRIAVLDDRGNITCENSYKIIKEKEIYDEWWFRVYLFAVFTAAIFYLAWLIFRTQFQRSMDIQKRELEIAKQQIEMGNEAIMTIARTVDAKDSNTSQHSYRVSEYSVMIAKKLGFNDIQCEELRKTALLHDIGKIGIPDSVLNKPAKLTDEEYAVMKTHVIKGAEILQNFTTIEHIVEGAKYHHERYDGRGYMQGLKGEEIPVNARIIGIADAFDAMTANRVYRKQLDINFVLAELKRCKGTQFDPKLTDIMLGLIEDGTIQIEKLYEESKHVNEENKNVNEENM